MPQYCPVCAREIPETRSEPPYNPRFKCPACGFYKLSERAAQRLYEVAYYGGARRPRVADNHHLLSAVIRERYEQSGREEVFISDFEEIRASAVPLNSPFDAVDRLLLYIARQAPRAGASVTLDPTADYPVTYSRDGEEFNYVLELATRMEFLEVETSSSARVGLEGWKRLSQLRAQEVDADSAFVAMKLAPDLQSAYEEGIEPALRSTGYRAIRVDLIEHNGKIDDRIVADIRKSALLVADFTGHRQNVYFEAGLALGLGRHIIWTCRESDIAAAHFDTRQYNHVVWRDPLDLRVRLQNRIEATIPRALDSRASLEPR